MASIINYALSASDSFASRPLSAVDSLCLAWLAYLHFPEAAGADSFEGVPLADLNVDSLRPRLVSGLHDVASSSTLVQAMARSPRFREVRACLHVTESSEEEGKQFSATTFKLPDEAGVYVAFRGTDDTLLGWKENIRLACASSVPAQERARRYLDQIAFLTEGPLLVGGHSKGGSLAAYACCRADDEVRARITVCYSHDGPGFRPEVRADEGWHADVPLEKIIPHASLVGMLFERSQQGLTVVRSNAEGLAQHAPFTWEVRDNDFVREQGMDYAAWKLAQRLNDWLEDMDEHDREEFAQLLCWLMDATGETSFSALLSRWSTNAKAMRAFLDAAPERDRELFGRTMDDLVATVLLGSKREYEPTPETPTARADAAARKLEDLNARANDHFSKLDRLTGGF